MKVSNKAIESWLDRHTTFVFLSSGVIGDMRGIATATFLCGENFIQILNTVMAQVCWLFLISFVCYLEQLL